MLQMITYSNTGIAAVHALNKHLYIIVCCNSGSPICPLPNRYKNTARYRNKILINMCYK